MSNIIALSGKGQGRISRLILKSLLFVILLFIIIFLLFLFCGRAAAQERDIKVGFYDNAPKIFKDKNGNAAGILPELLTEIARLEGIRLHFVYCEWEDCLRMVRMGKLDLLPDVAYTEERDELFAFHQVPALTSWSVIYRSANIEVDSVTDLENRRIAVLTGSVQAAYLKNAMASFAIDVHFVQVSSFDEAFRAVQEGSADMVAVNHYYGAYAARQMDLVETPIVFLPSNLFFVSGKGSNDELLEKIDFYLSQWRSNEDSPFFNTLRKWTTENPIVVVPAYVWLVIIGISIGTILTTLIAAYLRREVKRQTAKVLEGERRLELILDDVGSGIFLKDIDLRYCYVNQAICEMLSLPKDEILGKVDADIFNSEDSKRLLQVDRRVIDLGNRYSGREVLNNSPEGQPRTFFSVKKPIHDSRGVISGLCGVVTDITDQIEFSKQLEQLSHYDTLTGLLNHSYFMDQAEQKLQETQRYEDLFALLIVNLDNFKTINNSAGHRVGDALLKEVARQLRTIVDSRHMLARTMGDSFAILVEDLSSSKSDSVGEVNSLVMVIQQAIARPTTLEGTTYHPTASIGVSIFNRSLVSAEGAFKQAELALYEAKTEPRGSVRIFESEMEQLAEAQLQLEVDLHAAISGSQFQVVFQPQVDVSGELLGMEALVRWNHPKHGVCRPSFFLDFAEKSGLIIEIGKFVLERTCQQLEIWSRNSQTNQLVVAVNISALEFFADDFVDQIQNLLKRYDFNPQRLELELTESQFIRDFEVAISKMSRLKNLGLRMSLDDFGTGYSSLSRLKILPFDQLKIDASFVREVASSLSDAAIVKSILELSRALSVEVIAEGVESIDQREALIKLGCRKFQGYLIGSPAPLAELQRQYPSLHVS